MERLAEEDVAGARAALEGAPEGPETTYARGVLALFEQRYAEAVELIEASRIGERAGYLDLARAARDVTKDHLRAESDRFVVSYPKGKDEVLVPYLLQALEAQAAAVEKDMGWAPRQKVAVEVLDDVKELAKLSTLTDAEIRTSGTIAICKFNKLMITSPKALLKGYDWLDTAAHEYVHHAIIQKTRNRTPIWLHEGVAKWAETRWRGAGGQSFSPFSAALVRDAVRKGTLVTFEQMHPSMAKLPSQEAAALAFAEVMLAVEVLKARGGPDAIARTLALVRDGAEADQAAAKVTGLPWAGFLAEWRRHMAERPLPKGGEHELRKLAFRDDPRAAGQEWQEIADDRARGWARLGEIMRERGRWGAARVEYGKAVKRVGPRIPVLSNQYALAAIMTGDHAGAEKVLAEALEWNPEYPALRVQMARLLLAREDWKGAREHLHVANRQDPFDPEIHAGLAKAYEKLGDPGAASREARFAALLTGAAAPHSPAPPSGEAR
jgi:Flp pilus assembly protein TadD